MKHVIRLSLLGLSIAAGSMAMAEARGGHGGPDRVRMNFEQLDTDGDGLVTRSEIEARGAARFSQADANGDGILTAEELEAQIVANAKDRAARMIERMDENDDGQISQDEMPRPRGADRMFARADTDGDGALSKDEFDAAREKMHERHGKRHKD